MISLTNHHSQWGRSEVVIICPDIYIYIFICKNHSAFLIIKQAGLDSPAFYLCELNILEIFRGIPRGKSPFFYGKIHYFYGNFQ